MTGSGRGKAEQAKKIKRLVCSLSVTNSLWLLEDFLSPGVSDQLGQQSKTASGPWHSNWEALEGRVGLPLGLGHGLGTHSGRNQEAAAGQGPGGA
jgi:hypothetical protein